MKLHDARTHSHVTAAAARCLVLRITNIQSIEFEVIFVAHRTNMVYLVSGTSTASAGIGRLRTFDLDWLYSVNHRAVGVNDPVPHRD